MNKEAFRKIVQFISVLIGIFGAFFIIFFIFISYKPILEGNYFLLLFLLMGALFGAAMIWVSYQSVTNYSLKTIKSLSTIIVLLLFGQVLRHIEPQLKILRESGETELMLVGGMSPIIALIFCYWVLVLAIKRLTLDDNNK